MVSVEISRYLNKAIPRTILIAILTACGVRQEQGEQVILPTETDKAKSSLLLTSTVESDLQVDPTPSRTPTPTRALKPALTPTQTLEIVIHTPTAIVSETVVFSSTERLLAGAEFYVNPYSQAANVAKELQQSDPETARMLEEIAEQPTGIWLGDWTPNVKKFVAELEV